MLHVIYTQLRPSHLRGAYVLETVRGAVRRLEKSRIAPFHAIVMSRYAKLSGSFTTLFKSAVYQAHYISRRRKLSHLPEGMHLLLPYPKKKKKKKKKNQTNKQTKNKTKQKQKQNNNNNKSHWERCIFT